MSALRKRQTLAPTPEPANEDDPVLDLRHPGSPPLARRGLPLGTLFVSGVLALGAVGALALFSGERRAGPAPAQVASTAVPLKPSATPASHPASQTGSARGVEPKAAEATPEAAAARPAPAAEPTASPAAVLVPPARAEVPSMPPAPAAPPETRPSSEALRTASLPPDGAAASALNVVPAPAPVAPEPTPSAPAQPRAPLAAAEADAIAAKADAALRRGDISVARSFFMRLAQAGDPRGADGMARTYDGAVLKTLPVFGVKPDPAEAERWHARAKALAQKN